MYSVVLLCPTVHSHQQVTGDHLYSQYVHDIKPLFLFKRRNGKVTFQLTFSQLYAN